MKIEQDWPPSAVRTFSVIMTIGVGVPHPTRKFAVPLNLEFCRCTNLKSVTLAFHRKDDGRRVKQDKR
jgi:hypothetical protein